MKSKKGKIGGTETNIAFLSVGIVQEVRMGEWLISRENTELRFELFN